MAFVTYNPSFNSLNSLVSAIFTSSSGASLVNGSISAKIGTTSAEPSTISFYDGALSALGMGAGLLLTSGDPTPPESNTSAVPGQGYGVAINPVVDSDADLLGAITTAYDGGDAAGVDGVYDVTWLQFQINVTDPSIVGLRVDAMFGTEEYREYVGIFPDIAGIFVNGRDAALFNNDPLHPMAATYSNLDPNHTTGLSDGYFRDNLTGVLPIEYDGITNAVQVTAPLHMGINTVKIAVSDTGAADYDAALFVSNMQAVNYSGFGIATRVAVNSTTPVTDTAGSQVYLGNSAPNKVTLVSGLDVFDGGTGVDEATYTYGPGGIDFSRSSWNGTDLHLANGSNISELVHVERVRMAGGYYFALDTQPDGHTYQAYAMLQAAINTAPSNALLSYWVAATDAQYASGHDMGDVAQQYLNTYWSGVDNATVISFLYQNIAGFAPSQSTVNDIAAQVGPGHAYETMGDLLAAASMLSYNTQEIAGVVGSVQQLDAAYFP